MKLKVTQRKTNVHTAAVTALGWNSGKELYTLSDDRSLLKWSNDGKDAEKVTELKDVYPTSMHWFPSAGRRGKTLDVFAAGFSDGTFKLMSRSGKIEKSAEAHHGTCLCVAWNRDGSALATGGEDGVVKIWSRSGMLRSTLLSLAHPIYAMCWSPDDNSILVSDGKDLVVKPLEPAGKVVRWAAHDSPVLSLDWNLMRNHIVSGGEDGIYKVWDAYGRPIFASAALPNPVTAVKWAPSGEVFAASSFDMVAMCDGTGWTHNRHRLNTGSVYSICWAPDGTRVALGGASGAVVFGRVSDQRVEWGALVAVAEDDTTVVVTDVLQPDSRDELKFRDAVVGMHLSHSHLLVLTPSQCFAASSEELHSPASIDLRGPVSLVMQSPNHFLLVHPESGVSVYSYQGRLMSSPSIQGLQPQFLTRRSVSLTDDVVSVVDRATPKVIHCLSVATGKQYAPVIKHHVPVVEVAIAPYIGNPGTQAATSSRLLAFVDANRDLWITPIKSPKPVKVATMTVCISWHTTSNMLAAVVTSGKVMLWWCPQCAFIDPALLPVTTTTLDPASSASTDSHSASNSVSPPTISSFHGAIMTMRRCDGVNVSVNVPPHLSLLQNHVRNGKWDEAIRLCRFVDTKALWGSLASFGVAGSELNTAEVAYAACDMVDRLQFVVRVRSIPTPEGRAAQLALLRREPEEAVRVLIHAGLIYTAIRTRLDMFQFAKALDLAVHHKTHVDTVLMRRAVYLKRFGREETNESFIQYAAEIEVDEESVRAKEATEQEREYGSVW